MSNLTAYAQTIHENLSISNYVDTNKPTAGEKREASFTIGEALKKVRAGMPSDDEYGEWLRSNIIEKCLTTVPQMTLYRYRMLAEFTDSFELAEKVGFTNIYELMKEGNEDHKYWVLGNHENYSKRDLNIEIKKLLSGEEHITPEQLLKIENARLRRQRDEAREAQPQAVSDKAIAFAKFILNVDSDDSKVIGKAFKRMAFTFHPDKNPDNPEWATKQMAILTEARDILLK